MKRYKHISFRVVFYPSFLLLLFYSRSDDVIPAASFFSNSASGLPEFLYGANLIIYGSHPAPACESPGYGLSPGDTPWNREVKEGFEDARPLPASRCSLGREALPIGSDGYTRRTPYFTGGSSLLSFQLKCRRGLTRT